MLLFRLEEYLPGFCSAHDKELFGVESSRALKRMTEASRCRHRSIPFFLAIVIFFTKSSVKGVSERRKCTYESLLIENTANEKLLANLFSPLLTDVFFRSAFESQPLIVQNRNPGFYSRLIDLNVIGQYLESQDLQVKDPDQHAHESRSYAKADGRARKHGDDWKLVKRVFRNGDWWCSSPNISAIPLNVVRDSFQRKGYSIVINKMQEFHYPLKVVTSVLENLFGCPVNANVYLTPNGAHQAFESHFDWMDGIIVQVMGCKTWIVSSAPTAVRPMPDTVFKIHDVNETDSVRRRVMKRKKGWESSDIQFLGDDSNFISKSSPKEFDMKEGSLLYIPRGFTHQAATNCSGQAEDSADSLLADSDFSDVASIHVTFGLEAVTDSTVEIFLHHYISNYFEYQGKKFDQERANNTSNHSREQDQSDRCAARCRAGIASDHVTTLPISLLSKGGSTLRVDHLSACDLAHLILHSAATSDSQQGTAARTPAAQSDYIVSDDGTSDKQKTYHSGPSILRQAVATTIFMARNGYQPMIDDLIPNAMECLSHYLIEHTATEVIYNAILLGIDMSSISAYRDDSGQRGGSESSGTDRLSRGDKVATSSKNLNYIRRFMTSDPVISLIRTTPPVAGEGEGQGGGEGQGKGQGQGQGPYRQSDKEINELRLLLVSEEWSITLDSHDSVVNVQDFLLTVFSGLAESDFMSSGSGGSFNTTADHFCSSWKSMMDTLRAHTAAGTGP